MTYILPLTAELKTLAINGLQPILEEMSGEKLQYSILYGLREYLKGAVIKPHVDRIETHIISALIHVHHEGDIDWEIEVVGFDGKRYRMVDRPGDFLYYESSKLIHGRPDPYEGPSWVNCFLHFRREGYNFTPDNYIQVPGKKVALVSEDYG